MSGSHSLVVRLVRPLGKDEAGQHRGARVQADHPRALRLVVEEVLRIRSAERHTKAASPLENVRRRQELEPHARRCARREGLCIFPHERVVEWDARQQRRFRTSHRI